MVTEEQLLLCSLLPWAKSFGDLTVFEALVIFKSLTVIPSRKEFLQEFLQDSVQKMMIQKKRETIAFH